MIKAEEGGYVVYSEKGKRLSKVYATKKEADKRLQEIEYFKHKNNSLNKLIIH